MANEFDNLNQAKTSIKSSDISMNKLLKECKKLKEILSANKNTVFYVESLHEGIDFQIKVVFFFFSIRKY